MPSKIETLGASHLASEGFEVQRTNNFEIQIDNVGDVRSLILAVVSGFLPNESNEVISLNYGNTTITVAGKANANGSGSLVVRDFVQKDMEQVIDNWRKTVYDKSNDAIGFAADYKKHAYVTQYAPDGTMVRVWDLEGVWPSAVDYGQVSYDSPGVKTISITLQYDKATINRDSYDTERRTV
jgi:hypothetical protein